MKKIALTLSLFALLGMSLVAFAAYTGEAPNIQVDIWTLLTRALNWFFGIVIAIAAIMLVLAGFTYVTSAGNEDKMKTALNTLIYALIGVAIALLAKGLIYMVCTFVNQGGTCSFF
jgi:hypothetical protein